MIWIGLTGGIASGKSTVAERLKQKGLAVVHADEVAHLALQPESSTYSTIVQSFGTSILDPLTQSIDRRRLGDLIFKSSEQRQVLENIIHPFVRQQVFQLKKKWSEQGVPVGVYEIPLLFEKNLQAEFDRVVVVYTSEAQQMLRLQQRNSLTESQARDRLRSQMSIEVKRQKADDVILNQTDRTGLYQEVDRWLASIKAKYNLVNL